jgi:ABC-2 type transport system permease protein
MFTRLKHIIVKEFIQALRDKKKRFFLIGPPIIQLFLFGYVATTDVNHVATALYDLDHSQESRELVRRLEASGYFFLKYTPESVAEIQDLLDRGKVLCVIQINQGFGRDVKKGIPTEIQVLVDGTDSNTAMVALNYVSQIVATYAKELMAPEIRAKLLKIEFRQRVWYNPELRSRNYNIPGVIAMIIMLTCLMLTSMAVVREREVGTMEQLMVTPIKPLELILGKTIPFGLVSFVQMAFIATVGVNWFHIPIKGSFLLLAIGTAMYILSVLGIGLFLSTVTHTQQQAMLAAMLFNMPAIMLSGFMFPIENMPTIFQSLTYVNPLRYFLVIIRGIFLKGNGFDILWPQMAALLGLGLTIITLSSLRFRKRLG